MKKIIISKNILVKKYIEEQKTTNQIAEELKCSSAVVKRNIHKYNITMRDRYACKLIKNNKYYTIFSKATLIQLYLKEDKEINQISKIYNCNNGTVKKYLLHYNIPIRDLSTIISSHRKKWWKVNKNSKKGIKLILFLKNLGNKNREKNSIIRIGKTLKEVGHKNNCSCSFCKDKHGENNSNWMDGISKLPYSFEFNDKLKHEIRERDEYTCQLCNMSEEEHLSIFGRVLSVHHIDYDKMNSKKSNLITLCSYCNSRVNFNRKHWTEYFKNKIKQFFKVK